MWGCAVLTCLRPPSTSDVSEEKLNLKVLSKNAIWKTEARGVVRFSDSFLRFEYIPLNIWQLENVQWLSDGMMLFKGKHCVIIKMDFIQQIISANFCDMDKIPKVWLPFQSH